MRPRRGRVLLLVSVLLPLSGLSGSCTDCDTSCGEVVESDYLRFEGTYLGRPEGDAFHRFREPGGTIRRVRLFGEIRALDEGSAYRVPAYVDENDDELQASLPGSCSCGPVMTHADGSSIDTGFWAVNAGWWPSWTTLFLAAGVPTALLAAYAFVTRDRARLT